ncbi:MAG: NADH-quinone oxidoreductase subunit C [Deltaproteobacteria bacterium]|nr:NADH-quinone oxidoreductase subunit C [Deltaproteobacteria bacterium]
MSAEKSNAPSTPSGEKPPALTRLLIDTFGQAIESHHARRGEETVVISRARMSEIFRFLKEDRRCDFCFMMDLTAVDYLPRQPRFELVVHLKSLNLHHRLRVKVALPENALEVDSITGLWTAADWYERECQEMYGIVFKGHPGMEHLLLYEGFQGHPLRKDYEKGHAQPLVPLRPVRERYNYGETFTPVDPAAQN